MGRPRHCQFPTTIRPSSCCRLNRSHLKQRGRGVAALRANGLLLPTQVTAATSGRVQVSPPWSSSFLGRSGMRISRDLRSLKERSGATKNLSGGILESSNNRDLVLLQSSVTIICPTCICSRSCGKVSLLSTEGLFILDSQRSINEPGANPAI